MSGRLPAVKTDNPAGTAQIRDKQEFGKEKRTRQKSFQTTLQWGV